MHYHDTDYDTFCDFSFTHKVSVTSMHFAVQSFAMQISSKQESCRYEISSVKALLKSADSWSSLDQAAAPCVLMSISKQCYMLCSAYSACSHLCNYGLILDWIESTSRVDQPATHFQHLACVQGNAQLQGVQAVAIAWSPAPPDVRSLTDGAITATGDVTQDSIKQEGFLQDSGGGFVSMTLWV